MSYLFDGSNHRMTGTFTSTYSQPMTMACFLKITHPSASQCLMNIGNGNASTNDSYAMRTGGTQHVYNATSFDATSTASIASTPAVSIDGAWNGVVAVFTADTGTPLRDIYAGSFANSGTNGTARAVADAIQFIQIGETLAGANDFNAGLIAELAVWNIALVQADITAYMSGTAASSIQSANLIGYWPLSASNATQNNEGVDTGGDLTVTTATFDSDHPTITIPGASTRRRRTGLMGMG